MSRFCEIVFCVPLVFRRHVCLSNLKHSPSRELPLSARKTACLSLPYLTCNIKYSYNSGILLLVIAKCSLPQCAFLAYELFTGLNRGRTRRMILAFTIQWFSHDVTKIENTRLSILLRFYFHGV